MKYDVIKVTFSRKKDRKYSCCIFFEMENVANKWHPHPQDLLLDDLSKNELGISNSSIEYNFYDKTCIDDIRDMLNNCTHKNSSFFTVKSNTMYSGFPSYYPPFNNMSYRPNGVIKQLMEPATCFALTAFVYYSTEKDLMVRQARLTGNFMSMDILATIARRVFNDAKDINACNGDSITIEFAQPSDYTKCITQKLYELKQIIEYEYGRNLKEVKIEFISAPNLADIEDKKKTTGKRRKQNVQNW